MKGKPHPCPPPPPGWYAGRDEETLSEGPFDTREDAIAEALAQESFAEVEPDGWDYLLPFHHPHNQALTGWKAYIFAGQFGRRHLDLSDFFDAAVWLEDLQDRVLEDESDENGERHPLDDLTVEDIRSLEESVRLAIWHWQHRRQIQLRCYWMHSFGPYESVTVPHPFEDEI